MNVSKLQFISGKNFLILWNIMMVIANNDGYNSNEENEDYTTEWNEDPTIDGKVHLPGERILLDTEKELEIRILRNSMKFQLSVNKYDAIGFLITPCKRVNSSWTLYFRSFNNPSTINQNNFIDNNDVSFDTELVKYEGLEQEIFIGNMSSNGSYHLDINATEGFASGYRIYATRDVKLLEAIKQHKNKTHGGAFKFKKNFHNKTLHLEWPKNEISATEFSYLLIISQKEYFSTPCEFYWAMVDFYNAEMLYFNTKDTNYYMENAKTDAVYYCTIFLTYNDKFFIPYLYGKVKFSPLRVLKDGISVGTDLRSSKGKISYRYKVPKQDLQNPSNLIFWYVIACKGSINVKVLHKRKVKFHKMNIEGYETFAIPRESENSSYVIKITANYPMDGDNAVEIFATVRPKYYLLPKISNLAVKLHLDSNNNGSVYVAWTAASNKKSIKYCVYVKNFSSDTSPADVDQCHTTSLLRHIKDDSVITICKKVKDKKIITQKLEKLDPSRDYLIYVTAQKLNITQRVWYNVLRIDGNSSIMKRKCEYRIHFEVRAICDEVSMTIM